LEPSGDEVIEVLQRCQILLINVSARQDEDHCEYHDRDQENGDVKPARAQQMAEELTLSVRWAGGSAPRRRPGVDDAR
jgi:hypothetical protein